jgi:hypothetical protein
MLDRINTQDTREMIIDAIAESNADKNRVKLSHMLDVAQSADDTRKRLIHEMRDLAERLEREADRLDANPTYPINTLGVVRAQGQTIDRLCGELDVWCRALSTIMHLDELNNA